MFLDSIKFISVPGLAWQAAFKKSRVELDLLTDVDILLMIGKETRGGFCNTINRYAKANNKYMSDYYESKEFSCLNYWDINNLHSWALSQKLPTLKFEWQKTL